MATPKVNVSTSKWEPVMTDVPQGFIRGQILFNIFISDKDCEIEWTLNKLARKTKPRSVVHSSQGRMPARESQRAREKYVHVNIMEFNKIKCKSCTWVRAIPMSLQTGGQMD